MTKIRNSIVRCIKCKKESDQKIVLSTNNFFCKPFIQEQKCPFCGYKAYDISTPVAKESLLHKLKNKFK